MQVKALLSLALAVIPQNANAFSDSPSSSSFETSHTILGDRDLCSMPAFSTEHRNFTGLIVQHQKSLEFPSQDHLRLTRCLAGEDRPRDAFVAMNLQRDLPWGRKFCTGHKNQKAACYLMARRKRHSKLMLSVYEPGEWVGAVFKCPGTLTDDGIECTEENAVPLWPLISPNLHRYQEDFRAHSVLRTPILVTFDMGVEGAGAEGNPFKPTKPIPENWAERVSVKEDYGGGPGTTLDSMMLGSWYYLINNARRVGKGVFRLAVNPSTRSFTPSGDLRVRRPVRQLDARMAYEIEPEMFSPAPKLDYFERTELTRKALRKALESIKIYTLSDEGEEGNGENVNSSDNDSADVQTSSQDGLEEKTRDYMIQAEQIDGYDNYGQQIQQSSDSEIVPSSITLNQIYHLGAALPDTLFQKVLIKIRKMADLEKSKDAGMEEEEDDDEGDEESAGKASKGNGNKTRFYHAELVGDASSLLEAVLEQ